MADAEIIKEKNKNSKLRNDKTMNIIKHLRLQHNRSQGFLAYKCGVSQQAVAKWESGSARPSYQHLKTLAKIFDCELEFIGDELNGNGKRV